MSGPIVSTSGWTAIIVILPTRVIAGSHPSIPTAPTAMFTGPGIGPVETFMTTFIEKDSAAPAIFLVFAVCLLLAGTGVGLAYVTGVIGGKTTTESEITAPDADPTSAVEPEKTATPSR